MTPAFTLVLPVYHGDIPAQLRAAIASIFSNTLLPDRVLIVIDGPISSDLEQVICPYAKLEEVDVLRLTENSGLAVALNFALEQVATEIVVRADADDVNERRRFEKLISAFQEGYTLVGSQVREYDEYGEYIGLRQVPLTHEKIIARMRYRNPFNHMAVAYTIDLFKTAGGYPHIKGREDFGLWMRMVAAGAKCRNLPDSLVRVSAGAPLLSRRGGFSYMLDEIQLQKLALESGVTPRLLFAIVIGAARGLAFVLPKPFRAIIYRVALRKK